MRLNFFQLNYAGKLEGRLIRRPRVPCRSPRDVGKRQHTGFAHPQALGGFVTVHEGMTYPHNFSVTFKSPNITGVRGAESTVTEKRCERAERSSNNDCKQL